MRFEPQPVESLVVEPSYITDKNIINTGKYFNFFKFQFDNEIMHYLPAISEATFPSAVVVVVAAALTPFNAFLISFLGSAGCL